MSVSFSAYIVFGVRIKYEKLFQSGEQRGCDHETRDFQFCPECGEQMWISTTNKVELNPFENSLSDVSYYYSFEPSKRDNIVIGFLLIILMIFHHLSKQPVIPPPLRWRDVRAVC